MIPIYFGIHYHESEAQDDVVLFSAPEGTSSAAIYGRFEELKAMYLPKVDEFPSREDMVDHIFDTLADEFHSNWSYCEVLFHMDVT